jgi:hypothetical protein
MPHPKKLNSKLRPNTHRVIPVLVQGSPHKARVGQRIREKSLDWVPLNLKDADKNICVERITAVLVHLWFHR